MNWIKFKRNGNWHVVTGEKHYPPDRCTFFELLCGGMIRSRHHLKTSNYKKEKPYPYPPCHDCERLIKE